MPDALVAALFVATMMLGAGGMVTLILRARLLYGGGRRGGLFHRNETNDSDVRMAALTSYEKLAQEKIDVIKRAIDLGWGDAELKALDARLEQLVGRDEIGKIASGGLPSADLEGIALGPERELEKLRQQSKPEKS